MAKTNKNNRATNHGYVFPKDDSGKPLITMKQGIEKKHVFKPDYYREGGKDLFQRFEEGLLTKEETVGFYKGNIIKYLTRFEQKNGIEDLIKAQTYLNRLIEFEADLGERTKETQHLLSTKANRESLKQALKESKAIEQQLKDEEGESND